MTCSFCNITREKYLFENKSFFVVFDKNPISKWHCLIISKEHFNNLFDTDLSILKDLDSIIRFLTTDFKDKYWFDSFNLLHASWKNAQQSINHLHIHFVPRYKNDRLDLWLKNI